VRKDNTAAENLTTMTTQPVVTGGGRPCWECSAETQEEHFCPQCGKIQPQPPTVDYFSFFGLPRKDELFAQLERRMDGVMELNGSTLSLYSEKHELDEKKKIKLQDHRLTVSKSFF